MRKRIILSILLIGLMVFLSGCSLFRSFNQVREQKDPLVVKDNLLPDHIPGQVLIKTDNNEELMKIIATFNGKIIGEIKELNVYLLNIDPGVSGSLYDTIKEIEKNKSIEYVEPVFLYKPLVNITDEEFYTRQWGPMSIGLEKALDLAPNRGKNVVVAILDTGVDYTHPEFNGRVLPGYNSLTNTEGYEASMDDYGHGTHVAGIAAASMNEGKMAGIAPESKILPVKVLTENGGTDYSVARGIIWAVQHGADIINLSLGGKGYSQALQEAINIALENNVVVVAAMGNTGKNEVIYPGACTGVIAVGASNGRKNVAQFSTRGRHISVAAPGENIYSTIPVEKGGYDTFSGTSMATPHVTGAIALLLGENSDLTVFEIKSRLEETADDTDLPGYDENSGYGVINLVNLLSQNPATKYGIIKVHVTYGDEPVSGVEIVVKNADGDIVSSVKTNGQGYALIYNLEEGIYTIVVNIFGLIREKSGINVVQGQVSEVSFIEENLVGFTIIEGYVVESVGGSGIAEATVIAVNDSTGDQISTVTDEKGYFSFNVNTGFYTLTSEKVGYAGSKYQMVMVEENTNTFINMIQRPDLNESLSSQPPTISVSGITPGARVSDKLYLDINVEGPNPVKLITVRFEHLGEQPDFQVENTGFMEVTLDTCLKDNGKSYIHIRAYDEKDNLTQWTIPFEIENIKDADFLPSKVLINHCWAFTYGQSLGTYRDRMNILYENLNISRDPDIFEINGEEIGLHAAPSDSTIVVKLKWGFRMEALGYKVYRSFDYNGPYIEIADVSFPEYTDFSSALEVGKRVYYRVAAYNGYGMGEMSEPVWTEPLDKFNVYLESPFENAIISTLYPCFVWSHTPLEADEFKYVVKLEAVNDTGIGWASVVWDKWYKVYDGSDLIPGYEYEWTIYEAQAIKQYGTYSGAYSLSGTDGNAGNGTYRFIIDSSAEEPVKERMQEYQIKEDDGIAESIPLEIIEEGIYDIYTEKYDYVCDTVLYLLNSKMEQIDENDDIDSNNLYSKISVYLYPGTYYLRVEEYYSNPLSCLLKIDRVYY